MARIERRGHRWRARVFPGGGRERSKTFDRKADAERWARTQEADVARGQWVDPSLGRITFAAFVEQWKVGLLDLRDSSLDRNLGVADNHLIPRFGDVQLARITRADVKSMVAEDMEAGYSGSSVRRHVIVLRSILDAAVDDARIGRNVAAKVKLPPESARPMRFLTADQLAIAAGAVPDHYQALVMTAGWVGLRWGELAGLAVERVDLLRRTITVERQLTEVRGKLKLGGPKTSAGMRTVSIPADLTDMLAQHLAARPVQTSGLAFPTVRGQPMRRSNFRKLWRTAIDGDCERAERLTRRLRAKGVPEDEISARVAGASGVFAGTDLEGLVFHELRHTAAALAIAHGAHPLTVKERLGHSSIQVTMDRYGHLFPSQDQALAEALNASFRRPQLASTRPRDSAVVQMRRSEA